MVTSATYDRGGAISFFISGGSGLATVNSIMGRITAIGAGTIILIAATAGDADYYPASRSQVITISSMMAVTLPDSAMVGKKATSVKMPDVDASLDGPSEIVTIEMRAQ